MKKHALSHLSAVIDSMARLAQDVNVEPLARLQAAEFVADIALGQDESSL